jgi:RsiW-degrading membrane proteinase PrsW (M82 family)
MGATDSAAAKPPSRPCRITNDARTDDSPAFGRLAVRGTQSILSLASIGGPRLLIYIAMLMCAAAFGVMVYRYDLYDREPWYMLLAAVAMGFAAMHVCGLVEDELLRQLNAVTGRPAIRAVVVAVVEDTAKLLIVLALAFGARRHFNDPLDGIVYGTLAGLGAAVEESLLYLSLSPATMQTLGSELVRLVAHAMMGGIVGFAVGIGARPNRQREKKPLGLAACLLLSLAFHFTWDFIAFQNDHGVALRGGLMLLLFVLFLLWGFLVNTASRASRVAFIVRDEPRRGVGYGA